MICSEAFWTSICMLILGSSEEMMIWEKGIANFGDQKVSGNRFHAYVDQSRERKHRGSANADSEILKGYQDENNSSYRSFVLERKDGTRRDRRRQSGRCASHVIDPNNGHSSHSSGYHLFELIGGILRVYLLCYWYPIALQQTSLHDWQHELFSVNKYWAAGSTTMTLRDYILWTIKSQYTQIRAFFWACIYSLRDIAGIYSQGLDLHATR